MKNYLPMIKPLAFACSVALAACSSGGGDSAAPVTTVTGTAEAPNGVIAQFEHNKSLLVAAVEYTFPAAIAGITGLQPVTGATVELIRIDDDGNQVGNVLASTFTSITGDYSLSLPSGVSLAGNLIVRITGNSGKSLSAMVVDQAVDINPISQYILEKFVDDEDLVLGNLALNEVVSLQGKVEAFDLTATSDISSMLAALDAEVGELVDNEIISIASTPDDGTAAAATAGQWNIVEFGLAMHDNEAQNYGTFGMDVYSEKITIAAGTTAGEVEISTGTSFLDAWTNFSIDDLGVANIYHESSVGGSDTDVFSGTIDADGNITLEFPFEEDLQTVDVQQDPDGPDYGWRWPPVTVIANNTGNDNTMVFLDTSAGVRYETIDTNNDGVKDAVNPAAKDGDEAEILMTLLLKQGSGMTTSSIAGDYGLVTMNADVNTSPSGTFGSSIGVVTFNDSTDQIDLALDALDELDIERAPVNFTNVNFTVVQGTSGGAQSIPYTVDADGKVAFDTLEGFTNDDGSVIALLDVNTTGSPTITQVAQEMALAIKLGTSAPDMANAVFKLYPMIYGAEANGYSELLSLRSSSSLTFNAGATVASLDATIRGFERATDISSVEALTDDGEPAFDLDVTIAANGEIDMSEAASPAGADLSMKGFISADGKMMVLRFYGYETVGTEMHELGMIIGIRQ